MDNASVDAICARVDRLERENRRWRLAGLLVGVASLLALASVGRPRSLAAQQQSAERSTIILKFGEIYLNAQAITYIDFQSEKNKDATLVYFAGDNRSPLRLNRQNGEMMRPWLDGHSFDLSVEPNKDPAPKGFGKISLPER